MLRVRGDLRAAAVWPGTQHCMRAKWRRRTEGEGGGLCAPRIKLGQNSHKNSNKCPADIKTLFGGIDDREGNFCFF